MPTLAELKEQALAEAAIEAKQEQKRLKETMKHDAEEQKKIILEEKKKKKESATVLKNIVEETVVEEPKKKKTTKKKSVTKKTTKAQSPIKKVENKLSTKIDPKIQNKRTSVTKVELTDKEKLEDVKIKLNAINGMIFAFPNNSCWKGLKKQMEKRLVKIETKLKTKK